MTEKKILTPREYDVLHLVAHGLTQPEIAVRLGIAESTVKTHVERIFAKLEVHDRASAVHRAHKLEILT